MPIGGRAFASFADAYEPVGFGKGSGFSKTPEMIVASVVVAPTPTASVPIAVSVNAGRRSSARRP